MDSSVAVDLSDLSAQLDAWRQSHRKRARIPDHFYKSAVSLLDRYSVSAICQHTRLRPASLRKHAAPTCAAAPIPVVPPSPFLQLTTSDLAPRFDVMQITTEENGLDGFAQFGESLVSRVL